jgi:hypothetical protein
LPAARVRRFFATAVPSARPRVLMRRPIDQIAHHDHHGSYSAPSGRSIAHPPGERTR